MVFVPQELVNQIVGEVLNQLANLRICGLAGGPVHWEREAILDFVMRQPLEDIYIDNVSEIPLPVFLRLLRAAPNLFFAFVDLSEYDSAQLSDAPTAQEPTIQRLSMRYISDEIYKVLALPQLASHTAALRDLEFVSPQLGDMVPSHTLISNAADTLERVAARFSDASSSLQPSIVLLRPRQIIIQPLYSPSPLCLRSGV
ncbi:hypothetical protein DFH06DRAFT_1131719 [Mycena polygramma]|nr:hypothetical protein DFH06DRAFT_1131719 [Mycena polygramma]